MSTIVARLVPMHSNNETLWKNVNERPTLSVFEQSDVPLKLGRGSQTGIGSDRVSRRAAKVSWNNDSKSLILHCPLEQNHGAVLRNNAIIPLPASLSHGDVLSIGPNDPSNTKRLNHYPYRVELVGMEDSNTSSEAAAVVSSQEDAPPAAAAAAAPPAMGPLLFQAGCEEEVQCAVCMEICVEATTLVPCSHFFCNACTRSLQTCPTCRKPVETKMRIRGMDNLIWKLVHTSCHADTKETSLEASSVVGVEKDRIDDVEMYLQRTKRTLPGSKSVLTPSRSGKKRAASSKSPRSNSRLARKKRAVARTGGTTVDNAICID